jgi:3-methyladenine DNA glycosylase AlkD
MALDPRYPQAMRYIMQHQNGDVAHQMTAAGIVYNMNYGVSITQLRDFAKTSGLSSSFAEQLWAENLRETKLLALMIWDPADIAPDKADSIAAQLITGEMVEIACHHLFCNLSFARDKVAEWAASETMFVKMAGLFLGARLAKLDKNLPDAFFGSLFEIVSKQTSVNVIYIKKSIVQLLLAMASRSPQLKAEVAAFIQTLDARESDAVRFIVTNVESEIKYL